MRVRTQTGLNRLPWVCRQKIPPAQAIADLQEFTKVFMPGLPCAAQQQFAESAVATQLTTQQLGDGEGDVPMIQGMNDFPDLFPEQ